MAHELSLRADGSAEMAFIGDTPWHGLGTSVTKGASIGVWQKEAGMEWEAREADVLYRVHGETQRVTSNKVIYRSDTADALGVVGAKYNIVQPKEVLEFFRDLTEDGGWHIHTAGVLRGGRKLWAMASNNESANVLVKKDSVRQNLLLATSLDGSMKTVATPTSVCVVCANTLRMALMEGGKKVEISHRSIFDATAVKRALGVAPEAFAKFMQDARVMAETPIKLDESLDILRHIFQTTPKATPAPKKAGLAWLGDLSKFNDALLNEEQEEEKDSRVTARILELFDGAGMGADIKGRAGTRWGLFNAITQHVDHEMGRSDDTRLDSAWFGRGDSFKQQALELLTA